MVDTQTIQAMPEATIDGVSTISVKAGVVDGTILWQADGFNAKDYCLSTFSEVDQVDVLVDAYGHAENFGSGRAVTTSDGVSIKGAGLTPYATMPSEHYRTGKLTVDDAAVETIYLSCLNHLHPETIKPLGVVLLGGEAEVNLDALEKAGVALDTLDDDLRYKGQALLMREFPHRITHAYKVGRAEAMLSLRKHNKDIQLEDDHEFVAAFLRKIARIGADLWCRRISISGASMDNYGMDGVVFDVATLTFKRDFRNTYFASNKVKFWDDYHSLPILANVLCENVLPWENMDDYLKCGQTIQIPSRTMFAEEQLKAIPMILGLSEAEMNLLSSQEPWQYGTFCKALLAWVKDGTDVEGEGCEFEEFNGVCRSNLSLIGNDFRSKARDLAAGVIDESCGLSKLWEPLFAIIGHRDSRVAEADLINTDVTKLLRSQPELESRIKVALPDPKEIAALIDSSVNLFKNTVGFKR